MLKRKKMRMMMKKKMIFLLSLRDLMMVPNQKER
jgi:hypothetical protein